MIRNTLVPLELANLPHLLTGPILYLQERVEIISLPSQ